MALRYFNIFGPRQDPSSPYSGVLAKFITQMLAGQQPTILATASRAGISPTSITPSRLTCWPAKLRRASGRQGIQRGDRRRVTLNETFKLLQTLTSYSGSPIYAAERGGDIKHSLADISAAEKHLGYKPKVNFEEGLRQTVNWYRSQGKGVSA